MAEQGDGKIITAHLVLGHALGAGNWSLGADYLDQQAVTFTDRWFSSYPVHIVDANGTRSVSGTKAIADGAFGVPDDNTLKLDGGTYVRIPGARGQSAADYRRRVDTDLFVLAPYVYLQTPTQHGSAWLLGTQPLGETVTLFVEGLWNRRDSAQRTAPTPIISGLSPLPSLGDGTFGIPSSNWYNPFGVDIRSVNRRLVELPARSFNQHIDAWRALAGVRGGRKLWHWELVAAGAESTSESTEIGLPSSLRLIPALGPSGPDAQGRIVCGARDVGTGIVPAARLLRAVFRSICSVVRAASARHRSITSTPTCTMRAAVRTGCWTSMPRVPGVPCRRAHCGGRWARNTGARRAAIGWMRCAERA